MLGKETIDINSYGKSSGRNGNYSTNYQIGGRELMTPDEVRLLDNRYSLLFIRGERPVIDLKYDILKHPNVRYTTDGKGKPYKHGRTEKARATIAFNNDNLNDSKYVNVDKLKDIQEIEKIGSEFEIITSEEYFEIYIVGGDKENI